MISLVNDNILESMNHFLFIFNVSQMADVQNVLYIKEWMSKEPHLPSDLGELN